MDTFRKGKIERNTIKQLSDRLEALTKSYGSKTRKIANTAPQKTTGSDSIIENVRSHETQTARRLSQDKTATSQMESMIRQYNTKEKSMLRPHHTRLQPRHTHSSDKTDEKHSNYHTERSEN